MTAGQQGDSWGASPGLQGRAPRAPLSPPQPLWVPPALAHYPFSVVVTGPECGREHLGRKLPQQAASLMGVSACGEGWEAAPGPAGCPQDRKCPVGGRGRETPPARTHHFLSGTDSPSPSLVPLSPVPGPPGHESQGWGRGCSATPASPHLLAPPHVGPAQLALRALLRPLSRTETCCFLTSEPSSTLSLLPGSLFPVP